MSSNPGRLSDELKPITSQQEWLINAMRAVTDRETAPKLIQLDWLQSALSDLELSSPRSPTHSSSGVGALRLRSLPAATSSHAFGTRLPRQSLQIASPAVGHFQNSSPVNRTANNAMGANQEDPELDPDASPRSYLF